MLTFARRLASAAIIAILAIGNLAVCAGWEPTAEARMACCQNGARCPMHTSERRASSPAHSITQAQADSCCAGASNQTNAPVAGSSFSLPHVTTLPGGYALADPVHVLARQHWRTVVPLPVSPVPRHLLLSVLLV